MVKKVADLSKLDINEDEVDKFRDQLVDILDYFQKMDEAETEEVEATTHVIDIVNKMRNDEIGEELSREEALKNASDKEDGYFKGPRVRD